VTIKINRGREAGLKSEQRSETFTGLVWADPVLEGATNAMATNVFFAPKSRTYWHRHTMGQILYVTSGQGRVCSRGGASATIGVGDTVYIPPDEEHWHGADSDSYLVHLAISLGKSEWLDEVTDEEYAGPS
jgi:quercetin dioxygenase-like cupin family protein